jgi:hypothetical protein
MMIKAMTGKIDKILKAKKTKAYKKAAKERNRKRLAEWQEFLKEDGDTDWACILNVLKYKLERTRKAIVSRAVVADSEKTGKEIAEVEALLERVMADEYRDPLQEEFERKYGKQKFKFKPLPGGGSTLEISYGGKLPTAKMNREHLADSRLAGKQQEADLRKAFSLMADRLLWWWD